MARGPVAPLRFLHRSRQVLGSLWEQARATLDAASPAAREGLGRLKGSVGRIGAVMVAVLGEARWQAREGAADLGMRVRRLHAEHRRESGIAGVTLLLCLGASGATAAILATGGKANDVVDVNYTSAYVTVTGRDYVTVTTPTGVETRVRTLTEPGKRIIRTRVIHGPDGATTLLEEVHVAGPVQHLPGETKTVTGPTQTVTVVGPGETVTEVVTEFVTVTVEVPVTVTEDARGPGAGPG